MLAEGRMRGYIDQSEGYIYFDQGHPLVKWDERILHMCHEINDLAQAIEAQQ